MAPFNQGFLETFFHVHCKLFNDIKHKSLYLARKYACLFVLGYYLFLKAHSSPLALLSENSLHLGTDDVHGPISMHVK